MHCPIPFISAGETGRQAGRQAGCETNIETREVLAVRIERVVVELDELLCLVLSEEAGSLVASPWLAGRSGVFGGGGERDHVRATAEKSGGVSFRLGIWRAGGEYSSTYRPL